MAVNDIQTESRRLAILELLEKDPDYSINADLLKRLLSQIGFGVSSAAITGDLVFLEQVQAISVNNLEHTPVAILRQTGLDIASGTTIIPGIARPAPLR